MYIKSMLSSYESPMNRGRRQTPQKTYLYESNYTYRWATPDYEEKYRSYLKSYVATNPRKVRDHIHSSLRETLWRPITSRSSTYPVHAEEHYIKRPSVRYVKPSTARGLGSMAYYVDDEYAPIERDSRIGRGYAPTDGNLLRCGWGRCGRDGEGGRRKYRINIEPSWDAPLGIYVDELEEFEDPHLYKVAKNKIAAGKAYIRD